MSTDDIPSQYQGIIEHSDYLTTKVRRLENEIIQLRRKLDEAYELMQIRRSTSEVPHHQQAAGQPNA